MNTKFSKVEGYTSLVRDNSTNAILNTNMSDYQNYKNLKQVKESEGQKLQRLEDDMSRLKGDIDEIKNLLRVLTYESK
jgi:TolA-binding protein